MKSTMQLLVRGTLWLSIGGLSLGHAVAQHRKNDLEHERLKGRVKMLKTERARVVKESGKWIEKDKVTQIGRAHV